MQRHLHSGWSEEDASVYHSDPDARLLVATKRCFKQLRVAFRLCDEAPLLAPQKPNVFHNAVVTSLDVGRVPGWSQCCRRSADATFTNPALKLSSSTGYKLIVPAGFEQTAPACLKKSGVLGLS